MNTRNRRGATRLLFVFAVTVGASTFGCAPAGPRTYPVSGKLDLAGGDPSVLSGGHVDAVHQTDPNLRASGEIRPDGSFTLQSLDGGVIRDGAREGSYRVRIVLDDDAPANKKWGRPPVDPRFLWFETSGMSIQVPSPSAVTLRAAK